MKRILNSLSALSLVFILITFTGCGKSKIQQLKDGIAQFNTNAPMDLGIGQLQYVSYDEDANAVVFKFMIKSEYDDVFNTSPTTKEGMAALLTTNQMRPMVKLLAEAGVGMKWEYRSPLRDDVLSYDFSPSEIKEAMNSTKSNEESYEDFIYSIVESNNAACPVEVDEGVTMVRVYDDGQNIIFQCDVDENIYDMEYFHSLKSDIKEALLSDQLMSTIIDRLSMANRSVIYRYIGDKSGNICDIILSADDL